MTDPVRESQKSAERFVPPVDPERRGSVGRDELPTAVFRCADEITRRLKSAEPVESLEASVATYASDTRERGIPPERALAAFTFMVSNLAIISALPEHRQPLVLEALDAFAAKYCAEPVRE